MIGCAAVAHDLAVAHSAPTKRALAQADDVVGSRAWLSSERSLAAQIKTAWPW